MQAGGQSTAPRIRRGLRGGFTESASEMPALGAWSPCPCAAIWPRPRLFNSAPQRTLATRSGRQPRRRSASLVRPLSGYVSRSLDTTSLPTAMTTGTAFSPPQERIISGPSTASLDLQAILSSCGSESILSTRLSFSSTSSSSQFFDEVPPFPDQFNARVFFNHLRSPGGPAGMLQTPVKRKVDDTRDSEVATPTGRFLENVMKEKILENLWVTIAGTPKHLMSGHGKDAEISPSRSSIVIAGGDSTSPNRTCCTQPNPFIDAGCGRPTIRNVPATVPHTALTMVGLSRNNAADSTSSATRASPSAPDNSAEPAPRTDGPGGLLLVPTIMVSSSTAALLPSAEPSHNVGPHQELPLAVRRGKKPPPTLSLGHHPQTPDVSGRADSDSYPDIPSVFLGCSSTGFSPTSPAFPSGSPSRGDMGLSAMCSNLKALVPPPPFTPTEIEFRRPPSHPLPSLELETVRWGMAASAQLPDADDDEWGFVHGLVVDWHASRGPSPEISPLPLSAGEVAYTAINSLVMETSVKDTMVPCSPVFEGGESKPDASDECQPVQTPASVKQMWRKTVIIQAPDGDSQLVPGDAERLVHVDKPCGASVGRNVDRLLDQFDEPVPFEIPASVPLSAPVSVDSSFFTPPSLRPSSTASSARTPVRGILKEKKSVRFSAVPSLYEYIASSNDEPADRPAAPSKHHSDTDVLSMLRRFPMLPSIPHKSSPLRMAHLSDDSGPEERTTAPPAAAAAAAATTTTTTLPAGTARATTTSHRSAPPVRTAPPNKTSPPAKSPATTMARHPAVRALACRRPLSARQPVSPKLIVGSGPGGAVVGAPSLQSPYSRMPAPPKKSADERRAPLKTVSVRQNAPPERKPPSASPRSPVKPTPARTAARKGAPAVSPESVRRPGPGAGTPGGKENVVQHVLRTVSAPSTPKRKSDENAARRATVSVSSAPQLRPAAACGGAPVAAGTMASQKNGGSSGSRMPVPLRSIFTKLRA